MHTSQTELFAPSNPDRGVHLQERCSRLEQPRQRGDAVPEPAARSQRAELLVVARSVAGAAAGPRPAAACNCRRPVRRDRSVANGNQDNAIALCAPPAGPHLRVLPPSIAGPDRRHAAGVDVTWEGPVVSRDATPVSCRARRSRTGLDSAAGRAARRHRDHLRGLHDRQPDRPLGQVRLRSVDRSGRPAATRSPVSA